jgi:integrase
VGRKPTGTVWLDKGKWRVQITKSKRRWSSLVARRDGKPVTKAYAEEFRDRLVEKIATGDWDPWAPPGEPAPRDQRVGEYVAAYVERQNYSTVHDDRRRVKRYLAPSKLGRMRIGDVRPTHIAAFLDDVKRRASKRGGTIARTIRNIYSIVQRAFARATVDEVFEVSPCDAVSRAGLLPAIEDKKPGERVMWKYSRAEIHALTTDKRIPSDRRTLYSILFYTGCRFGEAAALQWGDYDPTCEPLGRITISRSVQPETREVKGTKTGAIKLAPVHPNLALRLAEWHNEFVVRKDRVAKPMEWIVPNSRGVPRTPSASHRALSGDLTRLGLSKRGMQQHGVRHTFVTLARADGARGEVLRWVTHAPPKAMLDQYTTMEWESLCAEVAKLRIP